MTLQTNSGYCASRRERLQGQLEARKITGLLVTHLANIFYLTGFRGSAGVALISPSGSVLWVDPRYTLQARQQALGVEVKEAKGSLLKEAVRWIRRRCPGQVGYEDSALTCREFTLLDQAGSRKLRWVPAGGIIEDLRVVKDAGEIDLIRQACRLTVSVFEKVRKEIRPGVREGDLAAEIEYRMKLQGAEGCAFETIVASGERSAWPHARASSKLLQKSDLVIIDLGAILGGYAADLTRTLYMGTPGSRVRRLYQAVREAQKRAVEAARSGRLACDIDRVARSVLDHRKLENYFTHSTGHGVGLEIHEKPRLGRRDKTRLKGGYIITVEPGVYLEGFGGIRVEDTVLVTAGAPEVLTPAAKGTWFTG